MRTTDPTGVYWGDLQVHSLKPLAQSALRRGRILPMEAKQLRLVEVAVSRATWKRWIREGIPESAFPQLLGARHY